MEQCNTDKTPNNPRWTSKFHTFAEGMLGFRLRKTRSTAKLNRDSNNKANERNAKMN